MTLTTLLEDLRAKDICLKIVDGKLWIDAPKGVLTPDLKHALQQHKAQILLYLDAQEPKVFLLDLPFPMGYGGLPQAQVEAAEAVNDQLDIKDLVHRKYNVLSWVLGYYQDRGENCGEHYEAIQREQLRLGQILDGEVDS